MSLDRQRTDGAYRGPRAFRLPAARTRAERDVAREIRFHLESCAADLVAAGWEPEAARAEAARRFGDLARVADECPAIEGERQARLALRDRAGALWQDLEHAWRTLARTPGFTLAALLTLGLALGARTAMFSVVDAVLLRALPLPSPERVVALVPHVGADRRPGSPGLFAAWSEGRRALSAAAAARGMDATLAGGDAGTPAERLGGLAVSGRDAEVLAVRPALGRAIGPDDDVPGAPAVGVLGHRLWRARFGGDPAALGSTVRVDGRPRTVVGVLPPALDALPEAGAFWVPLALVPSQRANFTPYLALVGRLRPGATGDAAARELDAVTERLGAPAMVDGARQTVRATPLLRQLTAEHLLLGLLAAAGALPVAWAGLRALVATAPPGVPRIGETGLDARAFAFAVLLGVACSLACGVAGAWYHARVDLRGAVQSGGARGATAHAGVRWRRLLVGAEAALALRNE